jgi:hypothetical protein
VVSVTFEIPNAVFQKLSVVGGGSEGSKLGGSQHAKTFGFGV